MERHYFVFEEGHIGRSIGSVINLGLHCPICNLFVGSKGKCPGGCQITNDKYGFDEEPIFGVPTPTHGFVFKRQFTPTIGPLQFHEMVDKSSDFIDNRGKMYTKEDFTKLLTSCELTQEYRAGEFLYKQKDRE